ncbi:MAG: hypothetical protein HYX69_18430 [Planctomycetia bacterium]|nr:hypothetical protein [Planctomycetia bacterium]
MSWTLSRYRAGDLVEVRGQEEILATLDERGCLDGMPFMPEMLRFCGQQFRVGAVAHKTCDTVQKTGGRRLASTVHLAGLRCDGSSHGGCQAACYLFWKDAWLKPAGAVASAPSNPAGASSSNGGCIAGQLVASTQQPAGDQTEEPRYSCQATQLCEATEWLPWWDARQYLYDVATGNHSAARVARVLCLALVRAPLRHVPFGYRIVRRFSDWMHLWLTGRPSPVVVGKVRHGQTTPAGRLDLMPGELVRIKSQAEIEKTLDEHGKNRGLSFDADEMTPYCGRVARVQSCVTRIIEEPTGKMISMKQPCIVLEGVVCNAESAACRLNCPRAIPSYWREIWLERVETPASSDQTSTSSAIGARMTRAAV